MVEGIYASGWCRLCIPFIASTPLTCCSALLTPNFFLLSSALSPPSGAAGSASSRGVRSSTPGRHRARGPPHAQPWPRRRHRSCACHGLLRNFESDSPICPAHLPFHSSCVVACYRNGAAHWHNHLPHYYHPSPTVTLSSILRAPWRLAIHACT